MWDVIHLSCSSRTGSVSYIIVAILSVALVRFAIVCTYPRRAIAADDLNASNDE
jgi:hypothetical protein